MAAKFPKVLKVLAVKDSIFGLTMVKDFFMPVLKFSYEIVDPGLMKGYKHPNGSWVGIFGMMEQGEADIIVHDIALNHLLTDVIDFTVPHYFDDLTFLVKKPTVKPKDLAATHPFSVHLWLGVLLFLIFLSLLFYKFLQKKRNFMDVVIELFGSLLNQPLEYDVRKIGKQLLFLAWIVGVSFLSRSYQATLLSTLTVPPLDEVRNAEELANEIVQGKYIAKCYHGINLIDEVFLHSPDSNMRIIGESLYETDMYLGQLDMSELSEKYKVAFIDYRGRSNPYKNQYYISDDNFITVFGAYAFRKDFCCKSEINEIILRILETGLYDRVLGFQTKIKYYIKSALPAVDSENFTPINLNDLADAFNILLFGWVLSLVVFTAEILKYYCKYGKFKQISRKIKCGCK